MYIQPFPTRRFQSFFTNTLNWQCQGGQNMKGTEGQLSLLPLLPIILLAAECEHTLVHVCIYTCTVYVQWIYMLPKILNMNFAICQYKGVAKENGVSMQVHVCHTHTHCIPRLNFTATCVHVWSPLVLCWTPFFIFYPLWLCISTLWCDCVISHAAWPCRRSGLTVKWRKSSSRRLHSRQCNKWVGWCVVLTYEKVLGLPALINVSWSRQRVCVEWYMYKAG